jgi:hypothetical protein
MAQQAQNEFYLGNQLIELAILGNDFVAINPSTLSPYNIDPNSEFLVMASPGNASYSQSLNMIYPWSDVSADIRATGINKTMNSSSIGLYQSESLDNWGYYSGSTFVSGTIETRGGADISIFTPYSAQDSDFNFGSGSYTIESWVNLGTLTSGSFPIATKYIPTVPLSSEYDFRWDAVNPGQNRLFFAQVSGTEVLISSSLFTSTVNEWHHVAVTKQAPNNNTVRLYLDGNMIGIKSGSLLDNTQTTITPFRMFGRQTLGTGGQAAVFYQDFRVYKGVAKYTGATYILPDSIIREQ